MIPCEKCGRDNRDDAMICRECGAPLHRPEPKVQYAPSSPEQKSANAVFCGKCGTKNPSDNAYCRSCGNPLVDPFANNRNDHFEPETVLADDMIVTRPQPMLTAGSTTSKDCIGVEGHDYVKVPIDKEAAMAYRVPTIIMGFVICVAVIVSLFVVKLPFEVYGASTGIPLGIEEYSLQELVSNGYSSILTLLVLLVAIMALLSCYSPMFGGCATVLWMIVSLCCSFLLQDVPSEYYNISLHFTEDAMLLTFGVAVILMVPVAVAGFCMYKFSKQYPEKGDLFVSSKLWKP